MFFKIIVVVVIVVRTKFCKELDMCVNFADSVQCKRLKVHTFFSKQIELLFSIIYTLIGPHILFIKYFFNSNLNPNIDTNPLNSFNQCTKKTPSSG